MNQPHITTVLFDLDGTLLPMNQETFIGGYFSRLAKKLAPLGYESDKLIKSIWKGTAAMVKNDGSRRNEEVFWAAFCDIFGKEVMNDLPAFDAYYRKEFLEVQSDCGFDPRAAEAVKAIRNMGYTVALATNPIFPSVATEHRIRWAGLNPQDFALFTTYENSSRCKPNPAYYLEVAEKLGVRPEECLMVGNDVGEDMVASEAVGMKQFLLTDCLINKTERAVSDFPNGSFPELMEYIKGFQA